MSARNASTKTLIDTGNIFQDIVDNIWELIDEHKDCLAVQNVPLLSDKIVKYDELKVYHAPFISIVFQQARTEDLRINNCLTVTSEVSIYFYFQSLNFGIDTYPFLGALFNLADIFIVHNKLLGLANGTSRGVQVLNASMIGRQLDSDAFLAGQLDLAVSVRSCSDDHSSCP